MAAKQKSVKFSLKEYIESHALSVIVGVAIISGGTVAGISAYISTEKLEILTKQHDLQVTKLESELSSINRGLAGGDFLNVGKFLIGAKEKPKFSADAQFFPDDLFYAPALPGWNYNVQTEAEVVSALLGSPAADLTAKTRRMHVWRYGAYSPLTSDTPFKNVASLVTVERMSHATLSELLEIPSESTNTSISAPSPAVQAPPSPSSMKPSTGLTEKDLKRIHLDTVFRGDLVGAYLASSLGTVFELRFVSNTEVELTAVQKLSNVLYAQIRLTLNDVNLNGTLYAKYYITIESIAISTSDDVYFITDFMPSNEPLPRGPAFAQLTAWLNEFAIAGH